MAQTTVASDLQRVAQEEKAMFEYVRDSIFARYMGTDENSIIQLNMRLGREAGQNIVIPLIERLSNSAVVNDNQLRGNEESLANYGHTITIKQVRNAVLVGKMEQQHTAVDMIKSARTMLRLWLVDDLRTEILNALGSPVVDGSTAYADATEAQKDTWVAAQQQSSTNTRVLFGAVVSNYSASDHSASLANVDSTTDVLDFDIVQLAKRLARKNSRHIRPVLSKNGSEFFVQFTESFSHRDLKTDTETIHQNAGLRGKENQLFQDMDLILDGVTCVEVPEIQTITGVGASSIDVSPNYFCGAQAVAIAWGQKSKFVVDSDIDYKNQTGVSVGEIRGVEKCTYNNLQNGVVTVYTSGVADS